MISIRPRGFKSSRGAPRGEDSREGLPRCPCILTQKKQPADLREQARTLNLDQERFDKCLVEGVEAAAVEKDAEEAKSSGITGTPSFFINGHYFSGVLTYAALHDMVEQQLAKSPSLAKRVTPLESTSK